MSEPRERAEGAPSDPSGGASSSVGVAWTPPVERRGAAGVAATLVEPLWRPGATVGAMSEGAVAPAIAFALAIWIAIGAVNVIVGAAAGDIALADAIGGALRLLALEAGAMVSITIFFAGLLAVASWKGSLATVVRAAGYGQVYLLTTLPVSGLIRVVGHGIPVVGLALAVSGLYATSAMFALARRHAPLFAAMVCVAPFVAITLALAFVSLMLAVANPFPIDRPGG